LIFCTCVHTNTQIIQKINISESCVRKVEEAAHAITVKTENVAKKEIECAQRELACELILENEARRVQNLLAQIRKANEKERLEFQRQTEGLELKMRDLTARLEIALTQKAAAEENLRDHIHRSSDEKLFEAFQRLKALVTAEHTQMRPPPIEEEGMVSFAEEVDSKQSKELLHLQISELIREKDAMEHKIRCQLESNSTLTSAVISAKSTIAAAEERLKSLQNELTHSRNQSRWERSKSICCF
jgi:hypothetical protein